MPHSQPTALQQTVCKFHLDTQYHIFHWGSTILGDSTLWHSGSFNMLHGMGKHDYAYSFYRAISLPDTQNCGLCMRRECRERFSCHGGSAVPTCITARAWCMPRSLTSGFLWSQWRGKRSRLSRRMHKPQFCVSGKRPIEHHSRQLDHFNIKISSYLYRNYKDKAVCRS